MSRLMLRLDSRVCTEGDEPLGLTDIGLNVRQILASGTNREVSQLLKLMHCEPSVVVSE